ncbi:unnamed protein product [Amoebophrya sp. A120]|nr:unnamed protein product [Amoebophrya sp. A120]|eukprot:GSA120T00004755001.1
MSMLPYYAAWHRSLPRQYEWNWHGTVKADHTATVEFGETVTGDWNLVPGLCLQRQTRVTLFFAHKTEHERDEVLRREVRILTRLKHPNFLDVIFPLQETEDVLFFIGPGLLGTLAMLQLGLQLEYPACGPSPGGSQAQAGGSGAPGRNLNAGRNKGGGNGKGSTAPEDAAPFALTDLEIRSCLFGVCRGLYWLHRTVRRVHRRLTPDCIFLAHNSVPKIAGLGCSLALSSTKGEAEMSDASELQDESAETYSVARILLRSQISTLHVAAEVVLQEGKKPDVRSDVFGVAVLLAKAYALPLKREKLKIEMQKVDAGLAELAKPLLQNLSPEANERYKSVGEWQSCPFFRQNPYGLLRKLERAQDVLLGLEARGSAGDGVKPTGADVSLATGRSSVSARSERGSSSTSSGEFIKWFVDQDRAIDTAEYKYGTEVSLHPLSARATPVRDLLQEHEPQVSLVLPTRFFPLFANLWQHSHRIRPRKVADIDILLSLIFSATSGIVTGGGRDFFSDTHVSLFDAVKTGLRGTDSGTVEREQTVLSCLPELEDVISASEIWRTLLFELLHKALVLSSSATDFEQTRIGKIRRAVSALCGLLRVCLSRSKKADLASASKEGNPIVEQKGNKQGTKRGLFGLWLQQDSNSKGAMVGQNLATAVELQTDPMPAVGSTTSLLRSESSASSPPASRSNSQTKLYQELSAAAPGPQRDARQVKSQLLLPVARLLLESHALLLHPTRDHEEQLSEQELSAEVERVYVFALLTLQHFAEYVTRDDLRNEILPLVLLFGRRILQAQAGSSSSPSSSSTGALTTAGGINKATSALKTTRSDVISSTSQHEAILLNYLSQNVPDLIAGLGAKSHESLPRSDDQSSSGASLPERAQLLAQEQNINRNSEYNSVLPTPATVLALFEFLHAARPLLGAAVVASAVVPLCSPLLVSPVAGVLPPADRSRCCAIVEAMLRDISVTGRSFAMYSRRFIFPGTSPYQHYLRHYFDFQYEANTTSFVQQSEASSSDYERSVDVDEQVEHISDDRHPSHSEKVASKTMRREGSMPPTAEEVCWSGTDDGKTIAKTAEAEPLEEKVSPSEFFANGEIQNGLQVVSAVIEKESTSYAEGPPRPAIIDAQKKETQRSDTSEEQKDAHEYHDAVGDDDDVGRVADENSPLDLESLRKQALESALSEMREALGPGTPPSYEESAAGSPLTSTRQEDLQGSSPGSDGGKSAGGVVVLQNQRSPGTPTGIVIAEEVYGSGVINMRLISMDRSSSATSFDERKQGLDAILATEEIWPEAENQKAARRIGELYRGLRERRKAVEIAGRKRTAIGVLQRNWRRAVYARTLPGQLAGEEVEGKNSVSETNSAPARVSEEAEAQEADDPDQRFRDFRQRVKRHKANFANFDAFFSPVQDAAENQHQSSTSFLPPPRPSSDLAIKVVSTDFDDMEDANKDASSTTKKSPDLRFQVGSTNFSDEEEDDEPTVFTKEQVRKMEQTKNEAEDEELRRTAELARKRMLLLAQHQGTSNQGSSFRGGSAQVESHARPHDSSSSSDEESATERVKTTPGAVFGGILRVFGADSETTAPEQLYHTEPEDVLVEEDAVEGLGLLHDQDVKGLVDEPETIAQDGAESLGEVDAEGGQHGEEVIPDEGVVVNEVVYFNSGDGQALNAKGRRDEMVGSPSNSREEVAAPSGDDRQKEDFRQPGHKSPTTTRSAETEAKSKEDTREQNIADAGDRQTPQKSKSPTGTKAVFAGHENSDEVVAVRAGVLVGNSGNENPVAPVERPAELLEEEGQETPTQTNVIKSKSSAVSSPEVELRPEPKSPESQQILQGQRLLSPEPRVGSPQQAGTTRKLPTGSWSITSAGEKMRPQPSALPSGGLTTKQETSRSSVHLSELGEGDPIGDGEDHSLSPTGRELPGEEVVMVAEQSLTAQERELQEQSPEDAKQEEDKGPNVVPAVPSSSEEEEIIE